MTIYTWFVLAFWLAFAAVWIVLGLRAVPGGRSASVWRWEIGVRLAISLLVVLVLHLVGPGHVARFMRLYGVNRSPVAGVVGIALCALGIGFAVVARLHLGQNWGMPMSRKEKPELVTTGPYASIRHPIYAGILLALLGSAIGQSILWALVLLLAAPYFIYSAQREEKFMTAQFPDQYPVYRGRTKMLLPGVL